MSRALPRARQVRARPRVESTPAHGAPLHSQRPPPARAHPDRLYSDTLAALCTPLATTFYTLHQQRTGGGPRRQDARSAAEGYTSSQSGETRRPPNTNTNNPNTSTSNSPLTLTPPYRPLTVTLTLTPARTLTLTRLANVLVMQCRPRPRALRPPRARPTARLRGWCEPPYCPSDRATRHTDWPRNMLAALTHATP